MAWPDPRDRGAGRGRDRMGADHRGRDARGRDASMDHDVRLDGHRWRAGGRRHGRGHVGVARGARGVSPLVRAPATADVPAAHRRRRDRVERQPLRAVDPGTRTWLTPSGHGVERDPARLDRAGVRRAVVRSLGGVPVDCCRSRPPGCCCRSSPQGEQRRCARSSRSSCSLSARASGCGIHSTCSDSSSRRSAGCRSSRPCSFTPPSWRPRA